MRRICLAALVLCSICACGQNWQTNYDLSRKAYSEQRYEEAIDFAEKAIASASPQETKQKAYACQLLTASSLEANKPAVGLKYIYDEIQLFSELEPESKNYAESLRKHGNLLFMSGKNAEALTVFNNALIAVAKAYGDQRYEYFATLANQALILLALEKYDEAQKNYETCLNNFPQFENAGQDLADALYYSASIDRKLTRKEPGEKKLKQLIALLEANNLTDQEEYSRARKLLAEFSSTTSNAPSGILDQLVSQLKNAIALQQAKPLEAQKLYKQCGALIDQYNIENNTTFSYYINYGWLLMSLQDYASVRAEALKARTLAGKLYSSASEEQGYLLLLEASLSRLTGEPDKALQTYRNALPCFSQSSATTRLRQTKIIAEALFTLRLDEGRKLFEHTLLSNDYSTALLQDKISIVRLYADLCLKNQLAAEALNFMTANSNLFTGPELKQLYFLYVGIANGMAGDLDKAMELLNEGVRLNASGRTAAELNYELARHQQQAGDYKNAESSYRKVLQSLDLTLDAFAPQVYNSFATYYIQMGNYKAAEQLLGDLLKNKALPPSFYNTVRQNLASIYEETGKYTEAKKLLVDVLMQDAEQGEKETGGYSIALQNLALLYQKNGQADSALMLMDQALKTDKRIYGENSLNYATKLANLASVYQALRNFSKAKELFEQALSIRKRFLNADHPDYAFNIYSLAYLLYRTQHSKEALPLFREASSYYIKQIKEVFPSLSDYERTVFFNKIQPIVNGYESFMAENVSLEPGLAGELLNFRFETKALLLNSAIKVRSRILSSGNNLLISKFSRWQYTKSQLAGLYALSASEQSKQLGLIQEYEKNANELEKWLSSQSELFAGSLDKVPTQWTQLQSTLKSGQAAIEIIRISLPKDSVAYGAIILRHEGSPQFVLLPGNHDEARNFKRYINSIRFHVEDDNSYNVYWKAIAAATNNVSEIYLSPDGVYTKINCLSLVDPLTKQYVIDRQQVRLVSNLKDLIRPETQARQGNHALLIGAPDFRLGATEQISTLKLENPDAEIFFEVLREGLSDLPGAASELSKVKDILTQSGWATEVYSGAGAREDVIKKIGEADIIHIATHGFFVAAEENAVQVSDNGLSNMRSNVMLRSGLLLAGAEKNLIDKIQQKPATRDEDGVLTALEVMNLNLDNTSIAVLSACETAGGDVRNGEGVYGLQRSFLLAGAKSVLMSLWKVDDDATQQLMESFYRFAVKTPDKSQAFRQAQLDIKKKFQDPYYWAAFVLIENH